MNEVALIPMGMGNWTIRVTAKVRADPHSVVAWFQLQIEPKRPLPNW
jgi:hypothetical protein